MNIWNRITQKRNETCAANAKEKRNESLLLGDMSPIDMESEEWKRREKEVTETMERQGYMIVMTDEMRKKYTDDDINKMIKNAQFTSGGHHYACPRDDAEDEE